MADISPGSTYVLQGYLPALGTASDMDIVVPFAGIVTAVYGVSSAAQTSGISTVTLNDASDHEVATLAFAANYAAGTKITGTLTAAYQPVTAGQVLTLATDGTGDGADPCAVTIVVEVR